MRLERLAGAGPVGPCGLWLGDRKRVVRVRSWVALAWDWYSGPCSPLCIWPGGCLSVSSCRTGGALLNSLHETQRGRCLEVCFFQLTWCLGCLLPASFLGSPFCSSSGLQALTLPRRGWTCRWIEGELSLPLPPPPPWHSSHFFFSLWFSGLNFPVRGSASSAQLLCLPERQTHSVCPRALCDVKIGKALPFQNSVSVL